MTYKDSIKHWIKFDHITFLLIAPTIFISKWIALSLRFLALGHDIYNQKKKE